ncbi:MAG: signal recognition particle subunit SRP19/SEC65 family protein [Methanomicrobium sp.]|jgi:signal recognition particle subunit SRP19|nr:signal recognition particle subunit SRP19/SEC65 family protein [Methanomicrobium sp.]MDD4299135.1 signal recognition particle subunit SRP19/SEC65 family protein [Methanomicrobium sp.]
MEREKVIYPCYFDESLTRKDGRRIKKTEAVKNPSIRGILTAVKKLGVEASQEQKSHPSHWLSKEGRILVKWDRPKEILIRQIAENLKQDK